MKTAEIFTETLILAANALPSRRAYLHAMLGDLARWLSTAEIRSCYADAVSRLNGGL